MARFHGEVGFLRTIEEDPINHPGVWIEKLTAKNYYGEIFSDSRKWNQNGTLNDGLVINNRISIVADGFMRGNLGAMKYVRWNGIDWNITNVEIQHPRVILTIGGEYHKPESGIAP
jgi:hypothetical protein